MKPLISNDTVWPLGTFKRLDAHLPETRPRRRKGPSPSEKLIKQREEERKGKNA